MDNNLEGKTEKVLKLTWSEFLKSPYSLLLFASLIVIGVFVYTLYQEKEEADKMAEDCAKLRMIDKEEQIKLMQKKEYNEILRNTNAK